MSRPAFDPKNMRNCEDGLLYLVDCTLATVEGMAMKKKPPAGELTRQIEIAQRGLDCLIVAKVDVSSIRAGEIVQSFNRSVKAWADNTHKVSNR